MAKRSNQKLKLLYLSKILLENTDERHGLTLSQIMNELAAYGVEAGRKSLYDDMEALRVYGLDIRTKRDRYVRYYVHDRKFDAGEIKIVSDMVADSRMFSEKKSRELIRKLQSLNGISKDTDIDFAVKAYSEDTYNNIRLICKAIESCNQITFRCFEWNCRKQRTFVGGGEFLTVSPCRLIFKNGSYFLFGVNHTSGKIELFNVERIINLSLLKKKAQKENVAAPLQYNVRMRCDKSFAGEIFDRFGLAVTLLLERDEYFEFAVKTEVDDDFIGWLFTNGTKVAILAPSDLLSKYQQMLSDNLKHVREVVNEEEQ